MGHTGCEKFEVGTPIPGSMVITVAPVIFQERFDAPPAETLTGLAVKPVITGGVPSVNVLTVTTAVAFIVPKLLIAVNV